MKRKAISAAALAAVFLLTLSACGKHAAAAEPTAHSTSSVQQTQAPPQEPWKVDFEKSLLENYGVVPKYYEDLENGIYQVYVERDGKLIPFVTVDSATGDYHG